MSTVEKQFNQNKNMIEKALSKPQLKKLSRCEYYVGKTVQDINNPHIKYRIHDFQFEYDETFRTLETWFIATVEGFTHKPTKLSTKAILG